MDKEQIKLLIPKYLAGDCNAQESALIESWYNQYQEDQEMELNDALIIRSTDRIHHRLNILLKPKAKKLFSPLTVAASVLLALSICAYLFVGQLKTDRTKEEHTAKIIPGRHGATLTLANGREIKLSDAMNGELAKESGLTISKAANGQLIYEISKQDTEKQNATRQGAAKRDAAKTASETGGAYNTLATSKGEIFQLLLPDGSKVWLNAASKLSYSVSLATDKKRVVKLNGEAYFEVFKDKKHPFVVNTGRQELEVLGTHFNINSYADEQFTRTTLIEGLVKVRRLNSGVRLSANGENEALLRPGQQSSVSTTGINVQSVDIEDAIAWKNGRFLFNDEPLESIMRKISRWYDVEVVYNSQNIKSEKFYGVINRFSSIDEVLKMMKLTKKVTFKIEGKRITVFAAGE